MSKLYIKTYSDGSELHFTDKGEPWYWVPASEVKAMQEVEKEYQKAQAKILWGKSK